MPTPLPSPVRAATFVIALTCSFVLLLAATGTATAATVSAGERHTCAVKGDAGEVWCWGANWDGQLGNGTSEQSAVPVRVSNLTGATTVAAGYDNSCTVRNDGTAWCWGDNGDGRLGDGTEDDSDVPVQVAGISGVTAIAAGTEASCAVHSGGAVSCWGANDDGVLGHGDTTLDESFVPVAVSQFKAAGGKDAVTAMQRDIQQRQAAQRQSSTDAPKSDDPQGPPAPPAV